MLSKILTNLGFSFMYHEGHHDHVSNWIPSYVGTTIKRTNWFMRVKSKWLNPRRPVASCNSGSNWSVDLHNKISHCMIMLLWLIYSMTTHLGLDCFTFPVLFVTLISCGVLIAFGIWVWDPLCGASYWLWWMCGASKMWVMSRWWMCWFFLWSILI